MRIGILGGTFNPPTALDFRAGTGYSDHGTPALVDDLRLYKRALSQSEMLVVQGL